jgi:hypothetical protein
MSRTYRKVLDYKYHANGKFYTYEEYSKYASDEIKALNLSTCVFYYSKSLSWDGFYTLDNRGRDHKPWNKPPKWFKKMHRRSERAKVKNAMVNKQYENIPRFKKTDQWEWI